jgi:succinyl-diaminopimelate desuccinylase
MSDLAAAISEHVSEDEVVEMCRALVRAESTNPPGDEREVASVSSKLLTELGLTPEFVEPVPNRVSTIASWGSGANTLLFNGHYDVVPVADAPNWIHPPFDAEIADGKIYGRGSADMKAGIAACLAAVATLQRAGIEPHGRLLMHFVADEEALGTHGTKWLVENGHCDGVTEALIGEPTDMHIVPAERGAVWLRIITEGVSAHGSSPRLGVNAIEHMAAVIAAVQKMRFRKLHELLGAPSINVGTIAGGSKVNVVPDHCEIEIDRRTLPGETTEEIVAEFEAALDVAREEVPDLKARIEVDDGAEPSETPEGSQLVELIDEARQAFGIDGAQIGYSGATDARFLINQAKIPSVIFGPGDLLVAHTTNEAVAVSQLVDATRAYAHVFARFLDAS